MMMLTRKEQTPPTYIKEMAEKWAMPAYRQLVELQQLRTTPR